MEEEATAFALGGFPEPVDFLPNCRGRASGRDGGEGSSSSGSELSTIISSPGFGPVLVFLGGLPLPVLFLAVCSGWRGRSDSLEEGPALLDESSPSPLSESETIGLVAFLRTLLELGLKPILD